MDSAGAAGGTTAGVSLLEEAEDSAGAVYRAADYNAGVIGG
ncbi:hypothetical protein JOC37_000321 [Desulfohalotomaculum tongense]|nr:hypothetical protein [Desulforadius tongensis]